MSNQICHQNLLAVSIQGELIAEGVRLCVSRKERKKGVLGITNLQPSQGALLDLRGRPPLRFLFGIHTVGVPFNLAAAWVGADSCIIDRFLAVPGRFYLPPRVPAYVLELHASHFEKLVPGADVTWTLSGVGGWKEDQPYRSPNEEPGRTITGTNVPDGSDGR